MARGLINGLTSRKSWLLVLTPSQPVRLSQGDVHVKALKEEESFTGSFSPRHKEVCQSTSTVITRPYTDIKAHSICGIKVDVKIDGLFISLNY